MEIGLNNREQIHLCLKVYIYEPNIRKKIIDEKERIENNETITYHIDRWNHIIGAFYYAKDNQSSYSLVYDLSSQSQSQSHSHIFFSTIKPPQYIIVEDYIKDFYNITNTSYQSWELLFELIKTYYIYGKLDALDDDILYSKLSYKLNIQMKNKIIHK